MTKNQKKRIKQRIIASFLLACMVSQILQTSIAMALPIFLPYGFSPNAETSQALEHWGDIAVLVEEGLMNDSASYTGLKDKYGSLTVNTLPDRIRRYARDAQRSQEYTRSILIPVKKDEKVEEIANALEKLYFEGDTSFNQINKLTGIVIIGDVPLPVVNKNGNHFVSLLPYTDFEDKVYIFDKQTGDYLVNANVGFPGAEIWQGLIKPPLQGSDGKKLLATYFDKNYLFHCKELSCYTDAQDFQQFTKKIFFMDLLNEFQLMDKPAFQYYLRFLKNWEDITYNRYNKYLLKKLLAESEEQIAGGDKVDNDGDGKIDEDPENGSDDDNDGEEGSPLHGLADGLDNDDDGETDEADEGRFGICDIVPNQSMNLKDCKAGGDLMDGNFYNVKSGSIYKVSDNVDNDGDGLVDEGIDEDDGDAFKNIDNDKDGLVDEDTPQDNDADGDGKVDEDEPGDKNEDGCSGACGTDEDLDSYDFDSDGYPNGYELEYGSLIAGMDVPTDPEGPESIPLNLTGFPFLRLTPLPDSSDWVDEEPAADDDEDGKVDEDGLTDNDKDGDGKTDEDAAGGGASDPSTLDEIPDAQTKPLVDQLANDYNSLFDKFFSNINDWTNSTGRYRPSYTIQTGNKTRRASDVATVPGYVTMKDDNVRYYLKRVNDSIEAKIDSFVENRNSAGTLQEPQLQASVLMMRGSTIEAEVTLADNSEENEDPVEFINFARHQYFDLETFSFIDDLFINGLPVKEMKSVQDCTLYRGSEGYPGSNAIMVEGNNTYNVFADGNSMTDPEYAGCTALNYLHPERCFIDFAKKPIFSLLGTKEVHDVPESAVSYQSCFSFKEKERYDTYLAEVQLYFSLIDAFDNEEAIATVLKPGSPYKPADQIVLLDLSDDLINPQNIKLTLADLLAKWGQADGIDNNENGFTDELAEGAPEYAISPTDYAAIGEQVLMKPATGSDAYVFTGNPLFKGPDIKTVKLEVTPEIALGSGMIPQLLSSFTPHKEPTLETWSLNSNPSKSPTSMPTDNPRFFTFRDKKGEFRTVKYPNIFAAKSLAEAKSILQAKEQELQQIADGTGVNLDIEDSLSSMIEGPVDAADPAKPGKLIAASEERLTDAYAWKNMNIDQKHLYVFETYLNPYKEAFIGETSKGYEALYFVSNGDADALDMNFNGDIPDSEADLQFKQAQLQLPTAPTQPGGGTEESQSAAEAYQSGADEGIIIFAWFAEIQKWLEETAASVGKVGFEPACVMSDAPGDYYDQLLATGDLDGDGVPDDEDSNPTNGDSDGDGLPDGAEKTVQLRVTASKPVMETDTGDTITLTVDGLDAQNQVQTGDSFTQIEITITNPAEGAVATVQPQTPLSLTGGTAEFTLLATDISGFFSVKGKASNRPNLVSNSLQLESTHRKIRLVSYRKSVVPVYTPAGEAGFIVKDQNGVTIAEVNGETGLITIKDDRFQLIAIPAKGSKPTRESIQEKETDIVFASVFFVPDKNLPIVLDGTSKNFLTDYESLQGIHVKDLSGDAYGLEFVPDDAEFNPGNVHLTFTQNGASNNFGIIERSGNIFLDDGYALRIKTPQSSLDPVVFEIANDQGKLLFEVYIGATFPKIVILKEEGKYLDYNSLSSANLVAMVTVLDTFTNLFASHYAPLKAYAQSVIPDTDEDGLNDLEEVLLNTDPQNSDTDGDTHKDEAEILGNYDPAKKDAVLFSDMSVVSQGFSQIVELFRRSILTAFPDGTFKPDELLTREEFVKLNLGTICISCTKFNEKIKTVIDSVYAVQPFPDTNFSDELLYCVKEAKNRQIVSGYQGQPNKGFFLPTNNITRAEATKVIIETGRQQATQGLALTTYSLAGKPWYYNYVLTAQSVKLYPKGRFIELDTLAPADFKLWFDAELNRPSSTFRAWIEEKITRREFSMMVSNYVEQYDCMNDDQDGDGLPDNYEIYLYGTSPTNP
ncbi:MAG TPA: S-layer homology domain-containing protein, partial [Candidatus Gracilibacteria bacterium]|nr:S-layer homology domain-containing protein [Candidatus Gracilibacteria bacterium]